MPRVSPVVVSCLTATILITCGIACGSKSGTNPLRIGGPSSRAPFSDGAWQIDQTITSTSTDSACAMLTGTSRDTFLVASGEVQDGYFGINCAFVTTGSNFTHACHDTLDIGGGCQIVIVTTGSGSVSGNTFTATYTLTTSGIGDCSASGFPLCTWRIDATGLKVGTVAATAEASGFPEMLERATRGKLLERIGEQPR